MAEVRAGLLPRPARLPIDGALTASRDGASFAAENPALERAHRVARALCIGTVWVNTPLFRDVRAPFGGIKDSGFGREGGRYGLEFYTRVKAFCVALKPPTIPQLGARSCASQPEGQPKP